MPACLFMLLPSGHKDASGRNLFLSVFRAPKPNSRSSGCIKTLQRIENLLVPFWPLFRGREPRFVDDLAYFGGVWA